MTTTTTTTPMLKRQCYVWRNATASEQRKFRLEYLRDAWLRARDAALPVAKAAAAIIEAGKREQQIAESLDLFNAPSEYGDRQYQEAARMLGLQLTALGYPTIEYAIRHVELRTGRKWAHRNLAIGGR